MNTLTSRWFAALAVAALVSFVGCGDEKPKLRSRTDGDKTKTDKTDDGKSEDGKTAKTNGASDKKAPTEGWGELRGKFVVKGALPTLPPVTISQDADYCNPFKESGELRNETIVVNDKNELKNVVIYMISSPERIHDDDKKTENAEKSLDNQKCRFEPRVTLLRTTQTLRIKNSDPKGHNTQYDSFSNPPFNELLPANSPGITKKLASEERFPAPVSCKIHPWMKGYLLVRKNPYMGVSGDDGSFSIKNIPAGEWEFQFWHEGPGVLEIGDWKRGRAKLTIEAGKPNDLGTVEVDAAKLAPR
jgi:hypothetical protein